MSGNTEGPIAVVGAGSIGVAFAIVFALARIPVRIQDSDLAQLDAVPSEVADRLAELAKHGLATESAKTVLERITPVHELVAALIGAVHVQECAPEQLELKQALFRDMDRFAPPDATLASSSSALQPSAIAGALPGRSRCLVAHPGNPPYLLRVIEVVPAPFTAEVSVTRAEALFRQADLAPVRLRKEVEGFVFNRLQGALLREAYCLVRDGVASVEDVDRIVRDGLGLRWSVVGPFESVDLNTRGGIASHAEKMGPAYARMGAERGQNDPWTPDLVHKSRRNVAQCSLWTSGPGGSCGATEC
jgi:3-hydroxyacyl-CoA dehydrogenase